MPAIRGAIKLGLFSFLCLCIPLQWLALRFTTGKGGLVIPLYWHRALCALFGLRVEIEGELVRDRQVILASNHVSYLDIPVFSTVAPWSFVARADVAQWPLFGTFARLQQTAFTSRSRIHALKDRNAISAMLENGNNLIIFPEGTSSDGSSVLPFKSSLLDSAFAASLPVQPVTLALLETDGQPADSAARRDLYAWHGDMTLPPHLWAFAKSRGARIRLVFHPPLSPAECGDRKNLALLCEKAARHGLEETFRSRGWRDGDNQDSMRATKETEHELFRTGSRQTSSLHAEEIQQ